MGGGGGWGGGKTRMFASAPYTRTRNPPWSGHVGRGWIQFDYGGYSSRTKKRGLRPEASADNCLTQSPAPVRTQSCSQVCNMRRNRKLPIFSCSCAIISFSAQDSVSEVSGQSSVHQRGEGLGSRLCTSYVSNGSPESVRGPTKKRQARWDAETVCPASSTCTWALGRTGTVHLAGGNDELMFRNAGGRGVWTRAF